MKLLHRNDLPSDCIWNQGMCADWGWIEPRRIAHEDSSRTIWQAPGGGYMGLVRGGMVAVRADSVQGVIELAEKLP